MNIRIPPHTNIAINQEKQFQKTNVKQTANKSKSAIQPFPLKGLPSNSKFNDGNKTISVSCPACKEHIGTIPTNEQISISNDTEPVETFKASVSTFGCDWEMLANVLGQTGPNGKYFCPFREVMLSDTKKGSPSSSSSSSSSLFHNKLQVTAVYIELPNTIQDTFSNCCFKI